MPKRRKTVDWIHKLKVQNSTSLPEGSLSEGKSAQEMATALKRSSPDFQAAMALLTVHQNTMGKRLSRSHERELERAKHILREMFKRQDRIEDYEIPKKKKRKRGAALHVQFKDEEGNRGYGDMFAELLGKRPEDLAALTSTSAYHKNMLRHIPTWEAFLKEYYKTEDLDEIKHRLWSEWNNQVVSKIPVWDVKNARPRIVNKEASDENVLVAVKKTQEVKEKRVKIGVVDVDFGRQIEEEVNKIDKLKQQAERAEELLREAAGKIVDLQDRISKEMKEREKSLTRLVQMLRDTAEDAQTVILEIGDTDVVLEEYVSQRPSYQAAFNLLLRQVDEQLRQSVTRALEASYEVKQKMNILKRENREASSWSEWWNKIVGWTKEIFLGVQRVQNTISQLRELREKLAAGQAVPA